MDEVGIYFQYLCIIYMWKSANSHKNLCLF